MEYAIRNNALRLEMGNCFEAAKAAGFDGVELVMNKDPHMDQMCDGQFRKGLRESAHQHRLKISSISFGLFRKLEFTKSSPERLREGAQVVSGIIDACKDLGGYGILLPHFDRERIDVSDEEAQRLIDGMKLCAPAAEKADIHLGLETSFSVELLQKIVSAVGSPRVGVYQDVANAVFYGHESVDMLKRLASEICMIHIKETDSNLLGEGKLNWPDVVGAIKGIGYDGWLVFETAPVGDPVESARRNLEFLKRHM